MNCNGNNNNKENRKYILTDETKNVYGKTLHRIKAIKDFGNVKTGNLGGWIEKEENLSHDESCWVYENARVYGNAMVCGKAMVYGNARVYGDAMVCGKAMVYGNTEVHGDARFFGNAEITSDKDYATISGFGITQRTTTFFQTRNKDKNGNKIVYVSCGCFFGTIDEFRMQVNNTRTGNVKEEYLMIADLMELHFSDESDNEE